MESLKELAQGSQKRFAFFVIVFGECTKEMFFAAHDSLTEYLKESERDCFSFLLFRRSPRACFPRFNKISGGVESE